MASHERQLFAEAIECFDWVDPGEGVTHNPKHEQGPMTMRRPDTVGEPMRCLHSVNWMRSHLPRFAEVKTPLQALIDERLADTRRAKNVAKRRSLNNESIPERVNLGRQQVLCRRSWRECPTRIPGGECNYISRR